MSEARLTECVVCLEDKPIDLFPKATITRRCTHVPSLCLGCTDLSLASQIQNGLLNQLRCPECSERLDYEEVQRCTSTEVFARYQAFAVEQLISKVRNFAWCPLGCGNGQVHDAGDKQPLVLCLHCEQQFCFRHRVAWHRDHTCDEYDNFLANPQNFRSKAQVAAALLESVAMEQERLGRMIQDADSVFAQSLLRGKKATQAYLQAKSEQERRAYQQAARMAEQRRLEEEAKRQADRLREEENATNRVFKKLTKPCPNCKRPIEKNGGCDHMTCHRDLGCGHSFSWDAARW
ncbi:hypothetical protein F4810DRAFT_671180 [Camillea tinctor]|nr:hypothetical protein F4810DRAFT_671180 [Camillea tinctor]